VKICYFWRGKQKAELLEISEQGNWYLKPRNRSGRLRLGDALCWGTSSNWANIWNKE